MSNLVDHAERELELSGLMGKDSDYNGMLGEAALEIVKLFAKQGHSGMSASLTTDIVTKLMRYEPITPLTGAADEWMNVTAEMGKPMWQNVRCFRVFKDGDGRAYDTEGIVFQDKDGAGYTNHKSRVYITFPYRPSTRYVKKYHWWHRTK